MRLRRCLQGKMQDGDPAARGASCEESSCQNRTTSRKGIPGAQFAPIWMGAILTSQDFPDDLYRFCAGLSAAARAKGVLKRQRKAGTVVFGRAAKLARQAEVESHGKLDPQVLDEFMQCIGHPGAAFVTRASKSRNKVSSTMTALPKLRSDFDIRVSLGESNACNRLRMYHAHTCNGVPDSEAGSNAEAAWAARNLSWSGRFG